MPTCAVWVAAPDPSLAARHLTDVERDRAESCRRTSDRDLSATAALLLRAAVGEALATDPAGVRIERVCAVCGGPHGRPRVSGTGLAVSVSRSGARVLVAVTDAGLVGVDVEERRAAHRGLARELLGPGERAEGSDQLLRTWTRKEAVVKATGDGLTVPLAEVVLGPPDEPPRLTTYRGAALACRLADLDVGPGCLAALAVLTPAEVEVEIRRGERLLAPFRAHPGAAYRPVVGCDPDASSR